MNRFHFVTFIFFITVLVADFESVHADEYNIRVFHENLYIYIFFIELVGWFFTRLSFSGI